MSNIIRRIKTRVPNTTAALVVETEVHELGDARVVESYICRESIGPQGMQFSPEVEVSVTVDAFEYSTMGYTDLLSEDLQRALDVVAEVACRELNQ